MNPVLVRGDGVSAYCCVRLLTQADIPVRLDRPSRPRLPAIMLSESAIRLLADVFAQKDLFRELPRIGSRSVLWGNAEQPVKLPHSAVVVSEETLLRRLLPEIEDQNLGGPVSWNVFSSRPLPPGAVEHGFGSRIANAVAVDLRHSQTPGCWVESTENGWLFLIGNEESKGWLLSVGDEPARALESSRLVVHEIERLGESEGRFPAFPRIVAPLGRASSEVPWLACGTAALGFDPICGDGTAHAVREAILGMAVIRAISAGAPAQQMLAHYESRMIAGFHRHLENCAGFYRSGGSSEWWRDELRAVEQGLEWCAVRMPAFPPFRYRLNGYDLEPVA